MNAQESTRETVAPNICEDPRPSTNVAVGRFDESHELPNVEGSIETGSGDQVADQAAPKRLGPASRKRNLPEPGQLKIVPASEEPVVHGSVRGSNSTVDNADP